MEHFRQKNLHTIPPEELEKNPRLLPKHTLVKALAKSHFKEFGFAAVAKIIADIGNTLTPLITRHLISYTMDIRSPTKIGVGYALGISFLLIICNFFTNIFFYNSTMTGSQVRSTLIAAIYKKNLRLDPKARVVFTNGKITNMMSTDTHRIDFSCNWFHFSWVFPVSIGISLALVITNIGAPGLVGFGVFLCSFLGLILTGKHMAKLRRKVTRVSDQRVSSMREILQAIKIIKFYSWEEAYISKISKIRVREMKLVVKMLTWRNMINAITVCVPTIAGLLSFIVLSKTHGVLNPATVFSSLSIFNIMRIPIIILPLSIITTIDSVQALARIERFLSAPETEDYLEKVDYDALQGDAIRITDGSFAWDTLTQEEIDALAPPDKKAEKKEKKSKKQIREEEEAELEREPDQDSLRAVHSQNVHNVSTLPANEIPEESEPTEVSAAIATAVNDYADESSDEKAVENKEHQHQVFKGLSNLNFSVRRGEFVIITGTIGTGKSSLLAAMSGMMRKDSGSVQISGSFVSAGQPWVQNATVRENILFGLPYDEAWYNSVIENCSLLRDFDILPAGDATEVGERGITLSGGQKARINLARAVYANRDIILLDDVLSAVDAHVGKFIMENCITGIMKGKTIILATHQLALIENYASRVIFLDGSGSAVVGTVHDLRSNVPAFNELMTYNDHTENSEEEEEEIPIKLAPEESASGSQLARIKTTQSETTDEEKQAGAVPANDGSLIKNENHEQGSISIDVLRNFVRHGSLGIGWFIVPVFIMIIVIANFCQVFVNVWLSYWTADEFPGKKEGFYIGIFVMFALLAGLFMFTLFFSLTIIVNRTSKSLHMTAVTSVLHAPMFFFDSSPLGRILNRFTHDTDSIDNEFSDQARLFIVSLTMCISTFILVICFLPWMAIPIVGLSVIFVLISSFYRASARDIKRLDSVGRSRVFALFGEALSGSSTVRAYGDAPRFLKELETQIDRMNSATFSSLANQRWLGVRLDVIGFSITLVTTMLCVTRQFHISPSSVGVVISSLLSIMPMMSLIVREMATTENNLNAVERVHEYAYDIKQEAPFHITETAPPPAWPERGNIEFNDVSLTYRPELPPALKNFNASIAPGEKIGICGRTGASKSTIIVALYRLVELCGGKIEIDGVDVSRIGLHALRSRIAIIPQDPVLFQGTIRSNIDPFGEYSDDELWDAMRRSWLIQPGEIERVKELESRGINIAEAIKNGDEIDGLPKFHLERVVDDDGTNFSLGERQLLALATALVRRAPILVLDEATSSVDFATDQRIQSTIVNEFRSCTILCIAHRLRTIVNYDRILVMDQGRMAEFDTPKALYANDGNNGQPKGLFRSMCEHSGISGDDFSTLEETEGDLKSFDEKLS